MSTEFEAFMRYQNRTPIDATTPTEKALLQRLVDQQRELAAEQAKVERLRGAVGLLTKKIFEAPEWSDLKDIEDIAKQALEDVEENET